jgi:hypothetical protein
VLSRPEHRYLARQLCWVMTIAGARDLYRGSARPRRSPSPRVSIRQKAQFIEEIRALGRIDPPIEFRDSARDRPLRLQARSSAAAIPPSPSEAARVG